jgi:hypothetical protein
MSDKNPKEVLFDLCKKMVNEDYAKFELQSRLLFKMYREKDALKDKLEKAGNESDRELIKELDEQIEILLSFSGHYTKMFKALFQSKTVLKNKWKINWELGK